MTTKPDEKPDDKKYSERDHDAALRLALNLPPKVERKAEEATPPRKRSWLGRSDPGRRDGGLAR